MSNKLSTKLSGFRKNYNTQYCLTYMLEKWKNTLDKVNMLALFLRMTMFFTPSAITWKSNKTLVKTSYNCQNGSMKIG